MWCRCLRQEMNYGHLFGIWVDKNRGQSLTPPMRLNNAQHINGVGTSKYATPKSHGSPYFFQSWEGESNTQSPISYCCLYIYICIYIYIYICMHIHKSDYIPCKHPHKTLIYICNPHCWWLISPYPRIFPSGWWFGTWNLFFSIGNVIIPTDELIFFIGVGIPPTSHDISIYIYISHIYIWYIITTIIYIYTYTLYIYIHIYIYIIYIYVDISQSYNHHIIHIPYLSHIYPI